MGESLFVFDCHEQDVLTIDVYKKTINFKGTDSKIIMKDVVNDHLSVKIA